MVMKDVNFSVDTNRFNFRVAGFIRIDDKILLQKSPQMDFYNLPGGRVKFGESTVEAIIREVKEELCIDIDAPKLFYVAENFFKWEDKDVQELVFIYKIDIDRKYLDILDHHKVPDNATEYTYWIDIANLKNITCKPNLIYDLPNITAEFTHNIEKIYK